MKPPVHVVCACNSGYIMPLCVMLASLADHFNRERELVIHILNSDSTQELRDNVTKSIEAVWPQPNKVTVNWYKVELNTFAVKQVRRLTMDAFSRLDAPQILPQDIEWALYLDCDIVVLHDISGLYDAAAGSSKALQAVQDLTCPWIGSQQGVFDREERGIPGNAPYFNSGVMLMNLPRWRELDLTKRVKDYVVENGPRINEADQGALNALCWNDWDALDQRWNTHSSLSVASNRAETGLSKAEWTKLRLHPYLIHYTADKKPWMKGVVFPRYSYFYRYLDKTPYKDTIPHRPTLEDKLGPWLYYYVWNFLRQLPRPSRAPAPAATAKA
jgi:lipopolysaccharide biosynthesis glycosyltransferase